MDGGYILLQTHACMGLSLCQHWDKYFSAKRIAFTAQEFLELLPIVPNKGWILWDEPGVYLSHRRWQSEINIQIMQVVQSFRRKLINVIFCLPSGSFMDKVVRETCHFVIRLQKRGQGGVYRICKTPFQGFTYTPYLGTIFSEMPTMGLWEEFRRLHVEHLDKLYEDSRKKAMISEKRKEEKMEEALKQKKTFEDTLERARLVLPQIVDLNKDSNQGLIDVGEMRRILKLPHNKAYLIRKALIKELHAEDNKLLKELRKTHSR